MDTLKMVFKVQLDLLVVAEAWYEWKEGSCASCEVEKLKLPRARHYVTSPVDVKSQHQNQASHVHINVPWNALAIWHCTNSRQCCILGREYDLVSAMLRDMSDNLQPL